MSFNRLLDNEILEEKYLKEIYEYLHFITDGKNYDVHRVKTAMRLKYYPGPFQMDGGQNFPFELAVIDKKCHQSLKLVLVFLCLYKKYNSIIKNQHFLYQELDNLQHLPDSTTGDNYYVNFFPHFEEITYSYENSSKKLIEDEENMLKQKNINTLYKKWKSYYQAK